ncbi:MAG: ABC transporter substrate-binding protein [Candidatus Auribacterota bacterium]|nr:ABC transporter substrate-binding protein [Candidatus Auribacterota bacterium]
MKIWLILGVISILLLGAFLSVPFYYRGGAGGGEEGVMVRRSALGAKIRGLDPQDIGDTTSSSVGAQIFETLYTYSYLERPYKVIPMLAEGMPEISDDGKKQTIRIRRGIFFADDPAFPGGEGRELGAEDFICAWKRMADLNNRSINYSSIFQGYVEGLDEFREYTATTREVDYDRPVAGLQAPDPYTLEITLTRSHNFLLYWLAHLPTAPMAREVVERYGKETVNHPVGTGPYKLEGDYRSNRFSMVRNENYREARYPTRISPELEGRGLLKDAGRRIPFIDRIEYSTIEESQPLWLAFMAGEIDAAGIPKDNFDLVITAEKELTGEMKERGINLIKAEDPSIFYYGFNMDDPVVGKNKKLRQAMSMAFDRETYIDTFLNGRGKIPVGPIPPMIPGYRPGKENPYTRYDLEAARKLLAEAVEINGGPIPLLKLAMPGNDTTVRQMGEFFRIQMQRLELEVEVDYMTWPKFQDATKTRSHQLFALGWVADYPDAQNFMLLFYGPNRAPGPNACNYSNPEFDALYEKAVAIPDPEKRLPLYHRMEDMVIEDCPWLLGTYRVVYALYYNWLKNYYPHDFISGTTRFQRVESKLREQMLR